MKSRPPAKLAQDQTTQRQINGQRVEEALEAASGADQVLVLALIAAVLYSALRARVGGKSRP